LNEYVRPFGALVQRQKAEKRDPTGHRQRQPLRRGPVSLCKVAAVRPARQRTMGDCSVTMMMMIVMANDDGDGDACCPPVNLDGFHCGLQGSHRDCPFHENSFPIPINLHAPSSHHHQDSRPVLFAFVTCVLLLVASNHPPAPFTGLQLVASLFFAHTHSPTIT
jgi:hypothetical protein